MQIYPTLLSIHCYWRWVVVLAAIVAIVVAMRGLVTGKPFAPAGRKTGVIFVAALDMQFILGIILEFLSPIVKAAFADFGGAMKVQELRFFAVEHIFAMLIAVVLAHVGSVRAKRATDDRLKYSRMLIWYSASFIVMLAGIPWWRPLFRGMGV